MGCCVSTDEVLKVIIVADEKIGERAVWTRTKEEHYLFHLEDFYRALQ